MALAYTAPTWTDGSGEGISASNLQAISDCIEGLVQGTDKAVHSVDIDGSIITLTFADGTQETASAVNLKGIVSITKTGTAGLVDTYTITYSDGTTDTFTVTNGTEGGSLATLSDVTITTPTDDEVLKYDSSEQKWVNGPAPAGGHVMIPVAGDMAAIAALSDGDDDYVVNAYSAKRWSNCDDIQLLVAVSANDDGVGTWEADDTWESGSRVGWITDEALAGILSDDDIELEPVFKVPSGKSDAVSAYAIRIDDAITGSIGGVAIKFNAPVTASGYVGVRLRHLRTNTKIVTP